jgi:iron-sulfur cluster assembly protein
MSITLTETAAARVREFIGQRGRGLGVRLGVRKTGCSGLAYTLEYADEVQADDVQFKDRDTLILVDPKSLLYLDGVQLNVVKSGLNIGFVFDNPNVKDTCGCGESFTV